MEQPKIIAFATIASASWRPVKYIPVPVVYVTIVDIVHNNYLLQKCKSAQMRVPKLTCDAWGLAMFQRQIAHPCAKYKARKAFLLCSGVLYRYSAVYLAGRHVKNSWKSDFELKILHFKVHFLCLKHLNSTKIYIKWQISLHADLPNTM